MKKFLYTAIYPVTRGLDPGRVFGSFQQDGVPNITGYFFGETGNQGYPYGGAFYTSYGNYRGIGSSDSNNNRTFFDASRSSRVYQNISEARVKNRAYLPVIKY